MSIWHEVQIELARDAADELIQVQGEDALLLHVKNLIGEAEDVATDLPEDNHAEAITRLDRSGALLAEAERKVPQKDEKPYRVLKNKMKAAQEAVQKTQVDFLSLG